MAAREGLIQAGRRRARTRHIDRQLGPQRLRFPLPTYAWTAATGDRVLKGRWDRLIAKAPSERGERSFAGLTGMGPIGRNHAALEWPGPR